ncbi:MAG: signal peptidase I [Oscillospiraceae bacterium]|nr:signal peptidase I [Oscillospiraceae bacterium]
MQFGIFPIKPVAVATGSMIPNINIGDVVIIERIDPAKVKINDVVEYSTEIKSFVHRVVEIQRKSDGLYFITKGDNNLVNDPAPVFQNQIVGKVIFRIPLVGYPAVWLNLSK